MVLTKEIQLELNFMIRIVKMTFDPAKVDEFLNNFNQVKDKIRGFEGVEHLELLNDKNHSNITVETDSAAVGKVADQKCEHRRGNEQLDGREHR